jgi:succinyl-CoA synthetase beta subunit
MKIHEYQAKELLAKYGVPIPKGRVATTPEEAAEITTELGGKAIVKAQVHAGGRGKAGGIKVVSSAEEAAQATKDLIGTTLVTFQTGPEGAPVGSVLVEELVDVENCTSAWLLTARQRAWSPSPAPQEAWRSRRSLRLLQKNYCVCQSTRFWDFSPSRAAG